MQEIRSMRKNNNSIRYLFLTLKLSEIKDSGKQGFTTEYEYKLAVGGRTFGAPRVVIMS